MDDHIFHMGVINRELCLDAPGFLRRSVVGEDADDIHIRKVLEIHTLRVADPAAEHQVKELLLFQTKISRVQNRLDSEPRIFVP